MFFFVLGQNVSILIESSSGPSKKIDPIFLEGTEDDSIRIEICCPNTIINIINVCSQTQLCQLRCLMTILDNYMFRPLLAIFRLSLRELKVLLYNVRAQYIVGA